MQLVHTKGVVHGYVPWLEQYSNLDYFTWKALWYVCLGKAKDRNIYIYKLNQSFPQVSLSRFDHDNII